MNREGERPTAGYDGSAPSTGDPDPTRGVTFTLEHATGFWVAGTGVMCVVKRNGEPVGSVRLDSWEEFTWLLNRINGVMQSEEG